MSQTTETTEPSVATGPAASAESPQFVHLHMHTQYSLLQGAILVENLMVRIKELGMHAVAMTDLNNLFGAVDFYQEAKKAKIKPIIGCEILYSPRGRAASFAAAGANHGGLPAELKAYHLVLLCKNYKGYQNLCQMVTRAHTEAPPPQKGQGSGPRALVDRELLDKYGDELIVLSGCLRSEFAYKILKGEEADALESIDWFHKRFKEDFYFELQDSGVPEQGHVNETLAKWGEKLGIPVVASVDCHYEKPENAEAHEVFQCIEHGYELDFDRPKSLVPAEFYIKPASLMIERFARFPEACANSVRIAEKCNVEFKFKDEKGRSIYHLPNFRPLTAPPPVGKPGDADYHDPFDLLKFFREESETGLEKRFVSYSFIEKKQLPHWSELEKEYRERLEQEIKMIERTGFAGYFLIVSDFIRWAKSEGIPVGPGRGSGAGSLVAYCLEITDIDPIQFKLLFERFINPERISMPDFDVDFCQDRRGEVIDYVNRRYGSDRVSQIITFGKLQTRAVIKDVGRVLGLSFADTDALTKLIPDELNISLDEAIAKEPRLRERIESDHKIAKWIGYARQLEGLYRSAGMHAAGVIITENPIVEYCPLFVGRDGAVVTQFDKDAAETIGLIKFDFLGLKTLTVVDYAVKLIRSTAEPGSAQAEFSIDRIRYDDMKVFALFGSGDTDGVFQVESSGMKDLCSRMRPNTIEDIVAICALYRPGPLQSGMVDDFIDRKHGRQKFVYDLDALEPILSETYGVILYQEQVMQIARELAGYSLGQADMLRRAMGKKKAEEMDQQRAIFVKGAKERGVEDSKAESIFDLMAKFAEYGFNKSHSAAYGVITYQTAYLKTYFPAEFMAALMTTEMDNTDKITKYIGDCREHQLPILPPEINTSQRRFSVERMGEQRTKAIRFGLEAIKGVGGAAVDAIIESRTQVGPFSGMIDFVRRVSTRKANKKVLESLTMAGAFDQIAEVNRASLLSSIEKLLQFGSDDQAEKELGQASLFDDFSAEEVKQVVPLDALFVREEEWPRAKALQLERQVVGFYLSGHPMDTWQRICEDWLGWSVAKIQTFAEEKKTKGETEPKANGASGGSAAGGSKEGGSSGPGQQGGQGGGFRQNNGYGGRPQRPVRPEVKLGGLIGEMREVMTKKGSRMGFGQIEDLTGKLEVVFFPEVYAALAELQKTGPVEAEPILLTAELELGEEFPKLLAKSVERVADAHKNRVQQVVFELSTSEVSPEQLRALKKSIISHRGKCPVRIEFRDPKFKTRLELPKTVGVAPTPQFVESVRQIFGKSITRLL